MLNKTDLKELMSLKDCTALKQLIVENPDLPLLIFAGEEAWSDNGYGYESQTAGRPRIEELTLYNGEEWVDKDTFRDKLSDKMAEMEEYYNLPDKEFWDLVEKEIADTDFVKTIVIYVG